MAPSEIVAAKMEELRKEPRPKLSPEEELEKVAEMLEDSVKRVRLMRQNFKGSNADIAKVCDMLAEKGYGLIAAGFHLGMLAICHDDCRIYCEKNGFLDEYPDE